MAVPSACNICNMSGPRRTPSLRYRAHTRSNAEDHGSLSALRLIPTDPEPGWHAYGARCTVRGATPPALATHREPAPRRVRVALLRFWHPVLGIPEQFVPLEVAGSKWEYALAVFEALHDGGSASRRVLRNLIGGWLQGHQHTPPRPEVRQRITALLAEQGWHVRENRLVIGERKLEVVGTLTALGQDARVAALHADVREVADRYLESGHAEVAIFEAFKAVNNRVRSMTGLDLDGSKLTPRDDPPPTPTECPGTERHLGGRELLPNHPTRRTAGRTRETVRRTRGDTIIECSQNCSRQARGASTDPAPDDALRVWRA
jgi:hypothetical protein